MPLTSCRRLLPSTEHSSAETETKEDPEGVEGAESADNGSTKDEDAEESKAESGEETPKIDLPEVPKEEPADEGPVTKKQKPNEG